MSKSPINIRPVDRGPSTGSYCYCWRWSCVCYFNATSPPLGSLWVQHTLKQPWENRENSNSTTEMTKITPTPTSPTTSLPSPKQRQQGAPPPPPTTTTPGNKPKPTSCTFLTPCCMLSPMFFTNRSMPGRFSSKRLFASPTPSVHICPSC